MESRRIRVSHKRQLTIPQRFYESLNIGDEVECILRNGELVLRPVRERSEEFAEEILQDLVEQGLSGQDLVNEFKKIRAQVRPAVERMLEEADQLAKKTNSSGDEKMKELFGDMEEE